MPSRRESHPPHEREADRVVPIPALLVEWLLSVANHTTAGVWVALAATVGQACGRVLAPTVTAWTIGSLRLGIAIIYLAPPPDRSKPVDLRLLAAFAHLRDYD
jgi:hypothetical protein